MKQACRYPLSICLLHWLLAIALVGNLVIGWLLDDNEGLLDLHKSIGIAILGLVLVRVANRLHARHRLPPSTNAVGTPAHRAEKLVHRLLYALMLAIPLLGWLKTNAAGHVANCFGLFSLPTLIAKSHTLSPWFGQLHSLAAYSLAALVVLHALGALAHWVFKAENILPRILPFPEHLVRQRTSLNDRD